MQLLLSIVIQAISGIIGGGIAGNLLTVAATTIPPKLVAGALGGIAGGSLLASLITGGAATADPAAAAGDAVVAAGSFDLATLLAQIGGGLIGGGLLTVLVGAVLRRHQSS